MNGSSALTDFGTPHDGALVLLDQAGRPDPVQLVGLLATARAWPELVVVSTGRLEAPRIEPLPTVRVVHTATPVSLGTARNIGLAATDADRVRFARLAPDGTGQVLGELLRDEVAPVGAFADASTIADARLRLFALLLFGNASRHLAAHLDSLIDQVDGVVALDCASTDGSDVVAARHPVVREVLRVIDDPIRPPSCRWQQRLLVNAAARHGAKWALVVDPHERLGPGFRDDAEALIAAAGPDGPLAYTVIREDGRGHEAAAARLFRIRRDHDFAEGSEQHWAPRNSRGVDGAFAPSPLRITTA